MSEHHAKVYWQTYWGERFSSETEALRAQLAEANAALAKVTQERDSIQHQEINAARREFNSMRRRAEDAERQLAEANAYKTWAEEVAKPALERSLACTLQAIAIATGFPKRQLTARDVLVFMQEGARLAKDAYPQTGQDAESIRPCPVESAEPF